MQERSPLSHLKGPISLEAMTSEKKTRDSALLPQSSPFPTSTEHDG
jgi:hypothetical protein